MATAKQWIDANPGTFVISLAALGGQTGIPAAFWGVGADALRGTLAKVGPDPPTGQPAVG